MDVLTGKREEVELTKEEEQAALEATAREQEAMSVNEKQQRISQKRLAALEAVISETAKNPEAPQEVKDYIDSKASHANLAH